MTRVEIGAVGRIEAAPVAVARATALAEPTTVRAVPAEDWDRLVREFGERTAFHYLGWLRTLEDCYGGRLVLLGAWRGRQIVGLWPVLSMRKGPFRVIGSPLPGWYTPYMGPLFAADADIADVLAGFGKHELFRRASYAYCKVVDSSDGVDLGPLGFRRVEPFRSSLVDLAQTEETLWGNMERMCQKAIRKARREGLTARRETGPEFMPDLWAMVEEVFARSGLQPPYTRALCEKAWQNLGENGQMLVVSAWKDGQRAAIYAGLCDDERVFGWAVASFDRYRLCRANNFVYWEFIQEARRQGRKYLDFVGATGGWGQFKKSFGAEQRQTAVQWELCRGPLARIARSAYAKYLWARRRLKSHQSPAELEGEPRGKKADANM